MTATSETIAGTSRAPRGWPATIGLLVGIWALLSAVVVGWGWLLTQELESSIGAVDDDVARWFADERTPTLGDVADAGTLLGETLVGVTGLVVVGVIFSVWQRSWLPLVFVLLVDAGIGAIYWLGTTLDPRDRPPVKLLDAGLVPDHSFPSGHVGTATALFGCTLVLVWVYARAARWWATLLLVLPAVCLLSRLYEGAHHLTDVLTSVAYTSVWIAAVASLVLLRDRRTS